MYFVRNLFGIGINNPLPSRAGVCFVFAFRAFSERFQSAFRALSVPFQGGGQKWAPTPSPERPTVVRRSSDGCPTTVRRPSNSREFPESEATIYVEATIGNPG